MLLSILIPTYNRAKYLKKNLYMLEKYITKNDLVDDVKIIVSNNCSDDNTKNILNTFSKRNKVKMDIYHQEENLGLERNVLFVLSKAKSEYVMTLGDDDYLNKNYLIEIINKLNTNKEIYCVIPSTQDVSPDGDIIESGRDLNIKSKIYNKGFDNCLINSFRGHQISGLTFKRDMILSSYKNNKVNNIYPQIYFVAYNCLRGKTWHFTDYPVKVTVAIQEDKDWGYEKDGLISEIFDNYKKLTNINSWQRSRLELKILNKQSWRYFKYIHKGLFNFIKTIGLIEKNNNTSVITKLLFPFIVFKIIIKRMISRILRFLLRDKFELFKEKLKSIFR